MFEGRQRRLQPSPVGSANNAEHRPTLRKGFPIDVEEPLAVESRFAQRISLPGKVRTRKQVCPIRLRAQCRFDPIRRLPVFFLPPDVDHQQIRVQHEHGRRVFERLRLKRQLAPGDSAEIVFVIR